MTENFFFSTGVEDDEASLSVSADKESPVSFWEHEVVRRDGRLLRVVPDPLPMLKNRLSEIFLFFLLLLAVDSDKDLSSFASIFSNSSAKILLVSAFDASDGRGGGEGDLKEANSAVNSSSFLLLLRVSMLAPRRVQLFSSK